MKHMRNVSLKFIILLIGVFLLTSCNNGSETVTTPTDSGSTSTSEESGTEDIPYMVTVDGHTYMSMDYVNSFLKCGTPDGKITESVDRNQIPEKDNQSNFGTGYEYQFWDESHINVKIDDKWIFFQNIAISARLIPDSVAHFTAEVKEIADDSISVSIVSIPDEFRWIFNNQAEDKIKPVTLSIRDFENEQGSKAPYAEDIKGKKIEIWFDGTLKSDEPEMSYPMELGKVYKISVVSDPISAIEICPPLYSS